MSEIKGVIDLSLADWDGKVCSVLFLPYCNSEFSKLKPFTDEEMKTFLAIAQKFLPNVKLR